MSIWKSGYDRLLDGIFYLPFGSEQRFRRKCLDFACIEKGDKVLDLCCGNGELTRLIAECLGSSGEAIGIDISQSSIKEATNRQDRRTAFACARGENLPFKSSIFDRCFLSFGLHHMLKPARRKTLQEVNRVLTEGGSLFIVEYNLPKRAMTKLVSMALAKLDASREAYRMLTKSNLVKEVQEAGLTIIRRELIGGGIIQLVETGKR